MKKYRISFYPSATNRSRSNNITIDKILVDGENTKAVFYTVIPFSSFKEIYSYVFFMFRTSEKETVENHFPDAKITDMEGDVSNVIIYANEKQLDNIDFDFIKKFSILGDAIPKR